MNPHVVLVSEGKKFMWDGQLYDSKEGASRTAESYQSEDFQVRLVEEGGKFLVYTRKPITGDVASAS